MAAGGPWLEEVEEEAELQESQVWRAAAAEEPRRGPSTEEGEEEGLLSHPWTAEGEGAEQSSGGGQAEEEELRHGKEVVEGLQREQSTLSPLQSQLPSPPNLG